MHFGFGLYRHSAVLAHKISSFIRRNILKERLLKIYFYPEKPRIFDVIDKIRIWKGYSQVDNSISADIKYYWEDTTYPAGHDDITFLNSRCKTIAKYDVSKKFQEIFNYPLIIDPTVYTGKCVCKSNLNATHDGIVITCPIENPQPEMSYQKLINNSNDNVYVEDIRIPYFMGDIPLVYLKFRPINTRFSNDNSKSRLFKPEQLLSDDEIKKLKQLCSELELDCCEMDAIRDYPEGKLYVVDVNHCPSGPPNHLSLFSRFTAIIKMADVFHKNIKKRIN